MELKDLIIEHDALRENEQRAKEDACGHSGTLTCGLCQQFNNDIWVPFCPLPAGLPAGLPATPLRSFQASPINLIGRLHAAAYVPATCSSRRHTLKSPMPEHLALLPNVPDSIAIDLVWLRCKGVYK